MEAVELRMVTKYLQKKQMNQTQDLVDTLEKFAGLYDTVQMWQTNRATTTMSTQENPKQFHDFVLQDRWLTIKQRGEDSSLCGI